MGREVFTKWGSRATETVLALLLLSAGAYGASGGGAPYPIAVAVSLGRTARVTTHAVATVPVACTGTPGAVAGACVGQLTLSAVTPDGLGVAVLGTAPFRLLAGQRAGVSVRLGARAIGLVLRAPAQRLRAVATVAGIAPYLTPSPLTLVGPESPYENPLRAAHRLDPWRIDEGVDYHGDGPVMAIGPGVVTEASTRSRFFGLQGANNTVYRLTAGSLAGRYIYVGEACTPLVRVGEHVTSQTALCTMTGDQAYPGIEIGFYAGPHDQSFPMAAVLGTYTGAGYPDGTETGCGVAMSRLLAALGAPPGNSTRRHPHVSPYVSVHLGTIVGTPAACLRARPRG